MPVGRRRPAKHLAMYERRFGKEEIPPSLCITVAFGAYGLYFDSCLKHTLVPGKNHWFFRTDCVVSCTSLVRELMELMPEQRLRVLMIPGCAALSIVKD